MALIQVLCHAISNFRSCLPFFKLSFVPSFPSLFSTPYRQYLPLKHRLSAPRTLTCKGRHGYVAMSIPSDVGQHPNSSFVSSPEHKTFATEKQPSVNARNLPLASLSLELLKLVSSYTAKSGTVLAHYPCQPIRTLLAFDRISKSSI